MAVDLGGKAPYAPGKVLVDLIRRHRKQGLPRPVTLDNLVRVGVSESLTPRTLQALRLLGLIDEGGEPTSAFNDIKTAREAEYRGKLEEHLRRVYSPIFEVVDPATGSQQDVEDAFRRCEPAGQRPRMVMLFLALCLEAGIVEAPTKVHTVPSSRKATKTAVRTTNDAGGVAAGRALRKKARSGDSRVAGGPGGDAEPPSGDPLLLAYFAKLPAANSVVSAADRERWLAALGGIFSIIYREEKPG